jgi:glycosyltransferase involved in cell wall biosynthesis
LEKVVISRRSKASANRAENDHLGPTLFITYDGLLDPLGQSQIIPYLEGIAEHPRKVHVLSFEKTERLPLRLSLESELRVKGIEWQFLSFTRHGGKIGKVWDLGRMHVYVLWIVLTCGISIIHSRTQVTAQAGLLAAKLFRRKLIFDMRGFWADERVDGGLWSRTAIIDKLAYWYSKKVELRLLLYSDAVVTLTKRSVAEINRRAKLRGPLYVIPCCADFEHFVPLTAEEIKVSRYDLGIPQDDLVLCYLGSLGTWYMFDEMLHFFVEVSREYPNSKWLVVTKDWTDFHEELVRTRGGKHLRSRIVVRSATRAEVPRIAGAADIVLSFIRPAYSKLASSPTKLGEALAMGLPLVCNKGVGDVDELVQEVDGGIVIDLSPDSIRDAITKLSQVRCKKGPALRKRARARLDLSLAHTTYRQLYNDIEATTA